MSMHDAFLKKIDRFCRQHGIAESEFGEQAVNDRSFVADLRKGRSPSLRIVERVEQFMKSCCRAA